MSKKNKSKQIKDEPNEVSIEGTNLEESIEEVVDTEIKDEPIDVSIEGICNAIDSVTDELQKAINHRHKQGKQASRFKHMKQNFERFKKQLNGYNLAR